MGHEVLIDCQWPLQKAPFKSGGMNVRRRRVGEKGSGHAEMGTVRSEADTNATIGIFPRAYICFFPESLSK